MHVVLGDTDWIGLGLEPSLEFWNSLFQKLTCRIFNKELSHSPYIIRRKTAHIRELRAQIGGESFHDRIYPSSRPLLCHDGPADVPIKQDQLPVDRLCRGGRR